MAKSLKKLDESDFVQMKEKEIVGMKRNRAAKALTSDWEDIR